MRGIIKPTNTILTAFVLSAGFIKATSSNIISGPKNASVAVFIPFNIGVTPKPNTGRRLSSSKIPKLKKATSKKITNVMGKMISNSRAIEFIPLLTKYKPTHIKQNDCPGGGAL